MAKKKSRTSTKDPAKEEATATWKYIVLILLVCGGALPTLLPLLDSFSGLFAGFSATAFKEFDVESSELSDVFFSGEPWLVLCKNKTDKVPRFWQLVQQADTEGLKLGAVPCAEPLKSGKNVYDRFKIAPPATNVYVPKPPPHAFYVANGKKPVMVPQKFFGYSEPTLSAVEKMVAHVKKQIQPVSGVVSNNADLQKKCLKKSSCVLILNAGKLSFKQTEAVTELMTLHRTASFVRMDTKKKKFSLESKLPAIEGLSPDELDARVVLLKREKVDNKVAWKAVACTSRFNKYNIDQFLTQYHGSNASDTDMTIFKKTPVIAARGGDRKSRPNSKNKKQKGASEKKAKKEKTAPKEDDAEAAAKQKERDAARERQRREQMDQEAKDSFAYVEENEDDERAAHDEDDEFVNLDDDGDDGDEEEVEAEDEDSDASDSIEDSDNNDEPEHDEI